MAINKFKVQGTKTWIADVPSTEWACCTEAIAGLRGGKEALCPVGLGELTRSRIVIEKACISSDESFKAGGKMTYGDFTTEFLFDPDDVAGQKALTDALDDNTPIVLGMESPDVNTSIVETDDSTTIIWTEALVSGDGIAYPENGFMGYSVTISPYGGYNRCRYQRVSCLTGTVNCNSKWPTYIYQ